MPVTHRPVQRVESTTSEYFTKSTRAISTTPPWHQQFIDIFDPHKPEHSLKNNNIGDDNDMQVWAEVLSAYSTNDMLIFISLKHFPCLEVAHLKPWKVVKYRRPPLTQNSAFLCPNEHRNEKLTKKPSPSRNSNIRASHVHNSRLL